VRGDVYRLRAPKESRGHEQRGARYCVELQAPINLSTVVVAPTSTSAGHAVFRPQVDIRSTLTRVLIDQLGAVDRELRLGDQAGRLTSDELAEVDLAMRLLLGLL